VAQAARGRYDFTQYRSLLDFQVSTGLLERAFEDTYGLRMNDVFADEERAISTYRYSVSQLIPALTKAAWRDKRDELMVFAYTPQDFEKTYGLNYQKPGRMARFLAVVYRLVPKVGPLKPLAFKTPTTDVDALFEHSVSDARARFADLLRATRAGRLDLPNTNFDTGQAARAGEYALADETHAEWIEGLAKDGFTAATPLIRRRLEAFYQGAPSPDLRDKKERKAWTRLQAAVAALNGPRTPQPRSVRNVIE
jgi:hypothetical protein